ncbi:M20/M25/M40 family metallo-hydrolase, partial [Ileibacterium valens]|uniref:M20/M25/M40 family metallo-hydrolase n=2 Tax=Ileibacterium valens TaxID=1862668 RepID=UPI0023530519
RISTGTGGSKPVQISKGYGISKNFEGKAVLVDDWKPVFFEKESALCKILQSSYEELTGLDGTPVPTTGGTYAKRLGGILPFGPSFPGQKGIAHLPNEWMDVNDLMKNAEIYALSLYRLSREDHWK